MLLATQTCLGQLALFLQRGLEGGKKGHDVLLPAVVAHKADAPDDAVQLAETAGNLDVVVFEAVLDHGPAVNALRDLDRCQRGQAVLILHMGLQADLLEALPEELAVLAMPLPAVLEALLGEHLEALAERIQHGDGRRVVVGARGVAVGHHVLADHVHVEVPVLDRLRTPRHLLEGALAKGQRGHAGRDAEGLLAACVGRVNTPAVEEDGHAADGGDRVREQEAVVFAADLRDPFHGLPRAGGGLRVRNPEELGLVLGERRADLVQGEHLAPRAVDARHVVRVPRGHVHRALAEVAIHGAEGHVAVLRQVRMRRFPRRRARAADRDGERVLRLPRVPQQLLGLLHELQEVRIHVAHHGCGHCRVHARMRV
mmetsp:Transcript_11507/g.39301  ORF Transcript_11507/g.39301 Transcript_11507/m.39301 type:complete len:370 (+) Transcript_11507:389-1498(+)